MAQSLPPQLIFGDVSQGVITGVSHRISPSNSVAHALNFTFDDNYGEATSRLGTTIVGSQVVAEDNDVLGLFNFVDSEGGANSSLISAVNEAGDASASIYTFDGSTWNQSQTGLAANMKVRFETFLDRVFYLNGTSTPRAWTGSGAWSSSDTALDIANMPVGSLVRVFKDQIVIAGVSGSPDDLRISSVPNTAGTAISWSSGDRTIRIDPESNDNITAFGEIAGLLVVFKRFGMYRWNNRATEADKLIDVGCSSQESVSAGADLLFFFNEQGVWITNGGYPVKISRRVQKWVDAISASFYENVSGHCDGRHYHCSIGDVTVDGTAYPNVVLRYTIDTKEWAVFSYAHEFRVLTQYVSSSDVQIVGGDTTARVLQLNSGLNDNGTAIRLELETHDQDFGSRGIVKEISRHAFGYGINPAGGILQAKTDDGDWKVLGHLDKPVQRFVIDKTFRGNFFRFRFTGTHSTARMRFQGLELPNVSYLDYGDNS